jgi:outer membrane protein W
MVWFLSILRHLGGHMNPFLFVILMAILSVSAFAEERFYARVYGGASVLGNQDISQSGFRAAGVTGEMETSLGYRAGFSFGYNWNESFSTEITWDYITNSAETSFSDGSNYSKGDYSSRLHFLNSYYHFKTSSNFRPYVGVGLGIIQEIDIDLENSSGEQSFSDDGGLGYQLIVGTEYKINNNWGLNFELTNIGFSGPDFRSEGGSSTITDTEGYGPWNVNVGLKFSF